MSLEISNNQKNLSFSGLKTGINKNIVLCRKSPVSDAFIKEMSAGIDSIDERVLKQIVKGQNLEYVLAKRIAGLFPQFKRKHPKGWGKGRTQNNVGAVSAGGIIGLFEAPIIPKTCRKDFSADYIRAKVEDVRHETGHELHRMFEKITGVDFTNTKGYTEAYLKDIKNLPKNIKNCKAKQENIDFATDYQIQGSTPEKATEIGKQETFAELFAMLNGGSGAEKYEKGMDKIYKQLFPDTVAYVEKLLYLMGKR